jgi:CubicO group peptidase (beta-lactamase class C family)
MLLGAIIEKVTGQNYFDYVREHLYKPAGMTNTDAYELDRETPNLATGYTREGTDSVNEWKNNIFLHVLKGGPAGGGYSTVEDLHHFALALTQHKLLNAEYTDTVLGGKADLPFGEGEKYAYGFFDKKVDGQRIVVDPDQLLLFWAGVSHQLVAVEELGSVEPELCNIYLPLDIFLFMPHIPDLQVALLTGGMVQFPAELCTVGQFRRWYGDYRTNDPERLDVVKMELNALFRDDLKKRSP